MLGLPLTLRSPVGSVDSYSALLLTHNCVGVNHFSFVYSANSSPQDISLSLSLPFSYLPICHAAIISFTLRLPIAMPDGFGSESPPSPP